MEFDSGISDRPDGDGQSQALEQREIDMDVQALRLEVGKAVRDGLEFLAHRIQVIQALLEAEVAQVVGAEFVSQKAGELLVLFEEGILPVGAKNMVTVLDLVDDGGQLPAGACSSGRQRSR